MSQSNTTPEDEARMRAQVDALIAGKPAPAPAAPTPVAAALTEDQRDDQDDEIPHIEMIPVDSTYLHGYGYHADSETLALWFPPKGGKPPACYHYANFGETEWAAFQDAESKGSFFLKTIRPNAALYPYRRVE